LVKMITLVKNINQNNHVFFIPQAFSQCGHLVKMNHLKNHDLL
jgi:hypothetical protein